MVWAGFTQPVRNIKTISAVTANNVPVGYGLVTTGANAGLITLSAAPAAGAVLRWSGQYYHRCRFADDILSPRQLLWQIWELGQCDLIGGLGAQIG